MNETARPVTPACPLHTPEWIAQLERTMHGGYTAHRGRRTGKSTRLALALILKALETPYEPLRIVDHHPTPAADRHLYQTIKDMIHRLDLQQLYLAASPHYGGGFTLTYGKRS